MSSIIKLIAFMVTLTFAYAGFKLPSHVFTMAELEKAKAEAEKEDKALAFVLSDHKTTCGLCVNSTLQAFKRLKSSSTIVYVNSKNSAEEYPKLSPITRGAMHTNLAGNYIPKAIITSPDQSKYFATIPYKRMKEIKIFSDAKKAINDGLDGDDIPLPKDFTYRWAVKNSDRFYSGDFVRIINLKKSGKNISLKKDDGDVVYIPMDAVSPAAQKYALQLHQEMEEIANQPVEEPWESAQGGKTINGTFVKLSGDKITLKMSNGKEMTFALNKLSETSQKRAKELAK